MVQVPQSQHPSPPVPRVNHHHGQSGQKGRTGHKFKNRGSLSPNQMKTKSRRTRMHDCRSRAPGAPADLYQRQSCKGRFRILSKARALACINAEFFGSGLVLKRSPRSTLLAAPVECYLLKTLRATSFRARTRALWQLTRASPASTKSVAQPTEKGAPASWSSYLRKWVRGARYRNSLLLIFIQVLPNVVEKAHELSPVFG